MSVDLGNWKVLVYSLISLQKQLFHNNLIIKKKKVFFFLPIIISFSCKYDRCYYCARFSLYQPSEHWSNKRMSLHWTQRLLSIFPPISCHRFEVYPLSWCLNGLFCGFCKLKQQLDYCIWTKGKINVTGEIGITEVNFRQLFVHIKPASSPVVL